MCLLFLRFTVLVDSFKPIEPHQYEFLREISSHAITRTLKEHGQTDSEERGWNGIKNIYS